jgi:hypothetical protein
MRYTRVLLFLFLFFAALGLAAQAPEPIAPQGTPESPTSIPHQKRVQNERKERCQGPTEPSATASPNRAETTTTKLP